MKKGIIFLVLIPIIILIIIWPIQKIINVQKMKHNQEQLATELGINISDYSYPNVFPAGYYGEILKEGMSANEVHEIIKGYEFVFHCAHTLEIYYFFSMDEKNSIRFMIVYDLQGRLVKLVGGNSNSSGNPTLGAINSENCAEGFLEFENQYSSQVY